MRLTILLIGAVSFFSSTVLAQIPNNGFENWTSVDGHLDPDDWLTANDGLVELGMVSCEQGAPGEVGSYYAKITSNVIPGTTSLVPGLLEVGNLDPGSAGFPYTQRPEALNGSIQYDIQPGDQGVITVAFTLNGAGVGAGALPLSGVQNGWLDFSVPIGYGDETTSPDSAYITILSSGASGVVGSTVSVDNLSFGALNGGGGTGGGAGIQEAQVSAGLRIYPTLTSDVLNVVADQALAQVDILDMTGRPLIHQVTNAGNITLDVSALKTGRYLAEVYMTDGRRLVRSFVKQ